MAEQRHEMQLDPEVILAEIEAAKARRAEAMPTEQDAIRAMFDAYTRLKELGWRDGRHMPTTGARFAGIQSGSTGIHAYTGEREADLLRQPMYVIFDGDLWPTRIPPVLFRPWTDTDTQPNRRPTYLGMLDATGD